MSEPREKVNTCVKAPVDRLTGAVIRCVIEVHRHLGPGLMESAYEECLEYELNEAGLSVRRQLVLPVVYKGIKLTEAYRIDLKVEEKLIVEVKAVESIARIHQAQLLTYMRLSGCKTGLLLNFEVELLKDGIKRMVL